MPPKAKREKGLHFRGILSLFFWSEWRDTAAEGVLPACRPKCFAFRYPSTHQKAKKLATGNFFRAFCPLRVQVPFNFMPKVKDFTCVKSFYFWSEWRDLNPRPLRPERSTLPNCATPRNILNDTQTLYYFNQRKSRKFLQDLTLEHLSGIIKAIFYRQQGCFI